MYSTNNHAQSQAKMKFTVLLLLLLGKPVSVQWTGCDRPMPENCINNPRTRLSKEKNYNLQLCHNGQCIPSEISDGKWLICKDGK